MPNGLSYIGAKRRRYWESFFDNHPDCENRNLDGSIPAISHLDYDLKPNVSDAVVVLFVSSGPGVGIFVRDRALKATPKTVLPRLQRHEATLMAELSAHEFYSHTYKHLLTQRFDIDMTNKNNWDRANDWHAERLAEYQRVLRPYFKDRD